MAGFISKAFKQFAAKVADKPQAGRSSGGFIAPMAANNTTKRKQGPGTNDLLLLANKVVKSK